MGLLTGSEFSDDLQLMLGNRGFTPIQLLRWLNFGYFDVAGAIDFPELDLSTSPSLALNGNALPVPADAMVIKVIKDVTADVKLNWLPLDEFMRPKVSSGQPIYWTRDGSTIHFRPSLGKIVPAAPHSITIYYKKEPVAITSGTRSVFARTWDVAILKLAGSHALYSLGEEARGAALYNAAIAYMQTRLTEENLNALYRGLEPSLPKVGA